MPNENAEGPGQQHWFGRTISIRRYADRIFVFNTIQLGNSKKQLTAEKIKKIYSFCSELKIRPWKAVRMILATRIRKRDPIKKKRKRDMNKTP